LNQVQQSQADFARVKAQGDAVASLTRVLDSLVEEDKDLSEA
jgi:hypothetical protein